MIAVHTLNLDNPFSGQVSKAFGQESTFSHLRHHSYRCGVCGQRVNARDLGQVFHHEQADHRPIPPQFVCAQVNP